MIIRIENTPSLGDDLLLSGVVGCGVVAVVFIAPVEVVPVVVVLRGVVGVVSFEQTADDLSSNMYAQPFSFALFSSIILKSSLT